MNLENAYKLFTLAGFYERYQELSTTGLNLRESYEATEKEHLELFRHQRYKTYDSFRSALCQYRARQREKKQKMELC